MYGNRLMKFVKFSSRSNIRNPVKTLHVLQFSSWSLVRTWWRFLMNLELVSDVRDYLSEAFVKVSSRSNIRNPVKTPPVLHVSFWSLGGHGGSWWNWRWCQVIGIILQKLLWKFHQDPTSETLSKLKTFIFIVKSITLQTDVRTDGLTPTII